jgi:hypothetical protein
VFLVRCSIHHFGVRYSVFDIQKLRCSLFAVRCSIHHFGVRHSILKISMFGVPCSLFDVQSITSAFDIRCSTFDIKNFDVRCSLFAVRCSNVRCSLFKCSLFKCSKLRRRFRVHQFITAARTIAVAMHQIGLFPDKIVQNPVGNGNSARSRKRAHFQVTPRRLFFRFVPYPLQGHGFARHRNAQPFGNIFAQKRARAAIFGVEFAFVAV